MLREQHSRCEICAYWLGDYFNKTHARIAGELVWVGQCRAVEERDEAPCAPLDNGAEAAVFTPPRGLCACFALHEDAECGEADADARSPVPGYPGEVRLHV